MEILNMFLDHWAEVSTVITLIVTAIAPSNTTVAKFLPTVLKGIYDVAKYLESIDLFKKKK